MAMFDLNYTPNHTKLGSSVNVKHFFSSFGSPLSSSSSPCRSVFLHRALQGTCSNDEGGIYSFLTSSGDPSSSHPRRLRGTGVTHNYPRIWSATPAPRPTPKLDWASSDWCDVQASTLITICQWLARANCRRLLCIHVLIMYIIVLRSSVSFQPRLFVLFHYQLPYCLFKYLKAAASHC